MRNPPLPTGFPKASPVIHAEARITGLTSGRTADRGGMDSYAWRTGDCLIGCMFTQNFMGFPEVNRTVCRFGLVVQPRPEKFVHPPGRTYLLEFLHWYFTVFYIVRNAHIVGYCGGHSPGLLSDLHELHGLCYPGVCLWRPVAGTEGDCLYASHVDRCIGFYLLFDPADRFSACQYAVCAADHGGDIRCLYLEKYVLSPQGWRW